MANVVQAELGRIAGPRELFRSIRRGQPASILLDGQNHRDGWSSGPLIALDPEVVFDVRSPGEVQTAIEALDRRIRLRRDAGGQAETGIALLAAYDLWRRSSSGDEVFPRLVALEVDAAIRSFDHGRATLCVRENAAASARTRLDGFRDALDCDKTETANPAARAVGRPGSSLPREEYLAAVRRIKTHIERGDIYQANLCQRFEVAYEGDPFELYAELIDRAPAPRSAFVEAPGFALASASPESFLRLDRDGLLETRPIKGTRPRGMTPHEDAQAAGELLGSEKDRAELLMIVDLERNDLSRVCQVGSVRVRELAVLESFAHVHHLVATVEGRPKPGTGLADLLRATFPGGSITGAPKLRAMEILQGLEPAPRDFFTGSLLWFGDDGTLDSSILIRTLVFDRERAYLGAGGGVVADSDPRAEWEESNHKARAWATALGFEPQEAS